MPARFFSNKIVDDTWQLFAATHLGGRVRAVEAQSYRRQGRRGGYLSLANQRLAIRGAWLVFILWQRHYYFARCEKQRAAQTVSLEAHSCVDLPSIGNERKRQGA